MINAENLLALRNAIDDCLADMKLKSRSAGGRLTKEDKVLNHIEKYYAGSPRLKMERKESKKLRKAS